MTSPRRRRRLRTWNQRWRGVKTRDGNVDTSVCSHLTGTLERRLGTFGDGPRRSRMLSSLGTASPRCAVTPLHCSLNRATAALHGDCDAILGQPALSHRRSRPLVMADAPRPRPQLSGALLVSDCAALVVYGLLASALKAFALAGSDLLSPVCHRRLEPRLAELRQVCYSHVRALRWAGL